ncbi:MAG: DUF4255 domain-containing protein [bacterium]|nr:DUF4255 domain-containing protein [bacterium]
MLNLLDKSLEAFLRSKVPLHTDEVDVSFEAPDRDWGAGISKPTVNMFVWDMRRNAEESQSGFTLVEDEQGHKERRPPLPRVDFRYLITAWTTEVVDEHALLGGVLAALLQNDRLEEEFLQDALATIVPLPTLRIAAAYAEDKSEFWSALGGQLKPGLDLTVTATVDAVEPYVVGPPVSRYDVEVADIGDRDRSSARFATATADGRVVAKQRE